MEEFLARGGKHQVLRFEATREDLFDRAEPEPETAAARESCWSPPAR